MISGLCSRFVWTFVLILFTSSLFAAEKEAVVIQVRKKLKLHNSERIYFDYFIKGGHALGLEKGVLVSVVRRLPVHDPFDNASVGDFHVKVADLEIIHADQDKSIGRLIQIDRREARPMLTYDAVMVGDRLDLDTMRAKVSYHRAIEPMSGPRSPANTLLPSSMPLSSLPQERSLSKPVAMRSSQSDIKSEEPEMVKTESLQNQQSLLTKPQR